MQFFLAPNGHMIAEQTKANIEYKNKLREIAKIFFEKHGISTDRWYIDKYALRICSTTDDLMKFQNQLKKDGETFKKSSEIHKAWICATKDVEFAEKPFLPFKFKSRIQGIKSSWSGFISENGDYYIAVEYEGEYIAPEGTKEISGSEYYLKKEQGKSEGQE